MNSNVIISLGILFFFFKQGEITHRRDFFFYQNVFFFANVAIGSLVYMDQII